MCDRDTHLSQQLLTTKRLVASFTWNRVNADVLLVENHATYFQTEDHQAEVPLRRNLKVMVSLDVGLQELCHLDALKTTN